MRILHTSDWHVGKLLRGASRTHEHRRVLGEIADIATESRADVVIVAGDVFDTAAPTAEAQQVAYEGLLALRASGAHVVVIAGNHDHAGSFEAVRPVFAGLGITVAGLAQRPDRGGVVALDIGGTPLKVALLPWLARQHVLRAEQLMELEGGESTQEYATRLAHMVARLSDGFTPESVNVVAAHAYVRGGTRGGGERLAQLVDEYYVEPQSFPMSASYVALGHLHRRQSIPGSRVPAWYCGSPIQVDFGDDTDARGVLLVDAAPGLPPSVEFTALTSPAKLATIRGPLAELEARAVAAGADHVRVFVEEAPRPGLADEVRAAVPNAVDVIVAADERDRRHDASERPDATDRTSRAPRELFDDYLDQSGSARDPRLLTLFDELHDMAVTP
ncbi:MAG TPA: exonuclease SbcCD subunit D [Acidimicrobiia bacterium]|jgi:exonuclease SbcD